MTRKCFFEKNGLVENQLITLPRETARHLESVLRSKPGDSVEIRDGEGHGWKGVIESMKEGAIQVRLLERQVLTNESSLVITLALAFSRSEKMEQVVRHATELGVQHIAFFRARRSQYGLKGEKIDKKRERWEKIAREALCQCGRARLPEIVVFQETEDFLRDVSQGETVGPCKLKIVALEAAAAESLVSLKHAVPSCEQVLVVVGPEGGWTVEEVNLFKKYDLRSVHLGPRILRLETAALAIVSCVQLLWGDFGQELG
jgi:16S rRNA (uracil1498-N3)-methyltransferase